MDNLRILLGISLALLCFNVKAQTQFELNQSACNRLKQTDTQLNKVYQNVLTVHAGDKLFIRYFKEAQRKWIAFRDAYADSMYIPEYYKNYGSIRPMCQCDFIGHLTNERIKQLKVWIDGVAEGDSCMGSTGN